MLGKNLGLLGLCLLVLSTTAQAGEDTQLTSLVWEGRTLVLNMDGPYAVRSMTLEEPDRIVIDLPQVRSELSQQRFDGPAGVRTIRVGQSEKDEASGLRCRIVLDLDQPLKAIFAESDHQLRVTLNDDAVRADGAGAAAGPSPVIAQEASPQAAPVNKPELAIKSDAASESAAPNAVSELAGEATEANAGGHGLSMISPFRMSANKGHSRDRARDDGGARIVRATPKEAATLASAPIEAERSQAEGESRQVLVISESPLIQEKSPVSAAAEQAPMAERASQPVLAATESVRPEADLQAGTQPTADAGNLAAGKATRQGPPMVPPLSLFKRSGQPSDEKAARSATPALVQADSKVEDKAVMTDSGGGHAVIVPKAAPSEEQARVTPQAAPAPVKITAAATVQTEPAPVKITAATTVQAEPAPVKITAATTVQAEPAPVKITAATTVQAEPAPVKITAATTVQAEPARVETAAAAPAKAAPANSPAPPPLMNASMSTSTADLGATVNTAAAPTSSKIVVKPAPVAESAVAQEDPEFVVETWVEPGESAPAPVIQQSSIALGEREAMPKAVVKSAGTLAEAKSDARTEEAPKLYAQGQTAPREARATSLMVRPSKTKPDTEHLTLELRGAEFRTLLRAFSEFSGYNIIAGNDVKGKVSVKLEDVPWRQALESVCNAHGFGVIEENGILRVAPRQALISEEIEQLTAVKKRMEYEPLVTKIFKMHYAVAAELTEPLQKMLSERGEIDVDERTNSLLITDLAEFVDQVGQLATELDHLMPQVEITARIVDVDYRASRDLGINWEAINLASHSADLTGSAVVDGSFPDPVSTFKLGTVRDFGELNLTLQALEKENKANIISNPRIMTMDNREADILVGKKIPLIVADEAGNAITQLTTIGIKLQVTPHINPDGQIMMYVHTEVSDLSSEATVQGGVIITTSESKTNVMVDDGQTAVIAGLIKSSDSSTERKVPVLGQIPILGYLFGYENNSKDKRELIIFITPRILTPGGEQSSLGWEEGSPKPSGS